MVLHNNKIILATNNEHKVSEFKKILKDFSYQIMSLKEAGIEIEIEENGKTFLENAVIKAKAIMEMTGLPSIADDSGLEVDALGGAPGVYSARYSGEHGNDKKNNEKLLDALKDIQKDERTSRFVCAIALIMPDGKEITALGYCNGRIGYEEKGNNGFGYDPLFIVPELKKTFAELSSDEKNAISHRGKALQELKRKMEEME